MIIADQPHARPRPAAPSTVARGVAMGVLLAGVGAALYYARLGLTLSHYDARGHLIVARRVIDSLTPGWQQIGAVWLPLPHLLNLLPVQIDVLYRTGASAVAISVISAAIAAYSIARLVDWTHGAAVPAVAAAAITSLNPNTLYLQSTPMTEPLLLAVVFLAVLGVREWIDGTGTALRAGVPLFLACWTRYEAWPIAVALLVLALVARVRLGERTAGAVANVARVAAYPAVAVLSFLVLSRITVGEWFVSGGFFVPENPALARPGRAVLQVLGGAVAVGGIPLVAAGCAAALALVAVGLASRRRASALVLLAPLAAAALPWYAFLQGHPYRVRYMVVQVAALALVSGGALALVGRRAGAAASVALLAITLYLRPPLDRGAAMVREAQWDRKNSAGRAAVTAYLQAHWDGTPIMASMGSLGHYMQELSWAGFGIRDFLHEGNGELWQAGLRRPAVHVRWILIEEKAEGGDMLAARARENRAFLAGFAAAARGGGVVLYRQAPRVP